MLTRDFTNSRASTTSAIKLKLFEGLDSPFFIQASSDLSARINLFLTPGSISGSEE